MKKFRNVTYTAVGFETKSFLGVMVIGGKFEGGRGGSIYLQRRENTNDTFVLKCLSYAKDIDIFCIVPNPVLEACSFAMWVAESAASASIIEHDLDPAHFHCCVNVLGNTISLLDGEDQVLGSIISELDKVGIEVMLQAYV